MKGRPAGCRLTLEESVQTSYSGVSDLCVHCGLYSVYFAAADAEIKQ